GSPIFMNTVMPVEVMIGARAVPPTILLLQRRVAPFNTGLLSPNHNALPCKAHGPDFRCVNVTDAGFDRSRSCRQGVRSFGPLLPFGSDRHNARNHWITDDSGNVAPGCDLIGQ